MGYGVWGLGFGVWGLRFGVWGLGFGVWGLGFGVWGLGFRVWGLGFGLCAVPLPAAAAARVASRAFMSFTFITPTRTLPRCRVKGEGCRVKG
jgi:hypothetical protein